MPREQLQQIKSQIGKRQRLEKPHGIILGPMSSKIDYYTHITVDLDVSYILLPF